MRIDIQCLFTLRPGERPAAKISSQRQWKSLLSAEPALTFAGQGGIGEERDWKV